MPNNPQTTDLINRLRGHYRTPITDGLGPAGGEEPDNPHEHVRTFPVPPIHKEAAAEIERLRNGIKKVLNEGVQKTEGPYSPKNNKCKHGRYGYEGCDNCTDEFLEELLNG